MADISAIPAAELRDGDLCLLPWCSVLSIPGVRSDLMAATTDPRMVRWTTVPHPYTEAHLDEFLAAPPSGVTRWAYVVGGRYCGNIEVRVTPDAPATLGYSAAPWARGRGLTTRAVRLVTAHAFAHGLDSLEIHAAEDNAASRHVAEVAGFTFAGTAGSVSLRGRTDTLARYVARPPGA